MTQAPPWETQLLGELVSIKTGKLDANAATPDGAFPFFTCSRDTFRTGTYAFDTEAVLLAGNNAAGVFPIKFFRGKFDAYQRTYVIETKDRRRLENRFLYYALQPQLEYLKSVSTGATTKFLTLTILKNLQLNVPNIGLQHRIAAILSAYDDLIENNTRRIAILEEMARRLYEEWFVHFRFPRHEGVNMVESEVGSVPEGWEVLPLPAAVDVNPRTVVPKEGDKLFVPMAALSETNMIIGPIETKSGNSGAKFQNGDTLVARITPCLENGKTGYVNFLPFEQPTACGSTEYIVLRPNRLSAQMVYLLARSDPFRDAAIKSMSGATGRQRVRAEAFDDFFVAVPDLATKEKFQRLAEPAFAMIDALSRKNTNLRTQRDLLLPKLISGEIDVSEAEQSIEEAAA